MAAFGPLSFLYPFDDFTFAYPYIFVLLLGWGCLKTFFLRFETAPSILLAFVLSVSCVLSEFIFSLIRAIGLILLGIGIL